MEGPKTEEQLKLKASRRRKEEEEELSKAEINGIEHRKTEKINKTIKIAKMDKPLAELTKIKREETQITNIRN